MYDRSDVRERQSFELTLLKNFMSFELFNDFFLSSMLVTSTSRRGRGKRQMKRDRRNKRPTIIYDGCLFHERVVTSIVPVETLQVQVKLHDSLARIRHCCLQPILFGSSRLHRRRSTEQLAR